MGKGFFIHSTEVFSITAGGSSTQSVNILKDADFEIEELAFKDVSSNLDELTIRITEGESGKNWFNTPVCGAIFSGGTANRNYKLREPIRVLAGSTITVEITNNAGSTLSNQLSFIGRKVDKQ